MSAKDDKPCITNTNDGKKLRVGAWDSLDDPAYHKARHVILANLRKAAPERVCTLCSYSLLHDCPNYEFGVMLHCKDCCKMADPIRPFVYNDYHVFPQEGLESGGEIDDCRGGYKYGDPTFHQRIYNDLREEKERDDEDREGDAWIYNPSTITDWTFVHSLIPCIVSYMLLLASSAYLTSLMAYKVQFTSS